LLNMLHAHRRRGRRRRNLFATKNNNIKQVKHNINVSS